MSIRMSIKCKDCGERYTLAKRVAGGPWRFFAGTLSTVESFDEFMKKHHSCSDASLMDGLNFEFDLDEA